MRRNRRLPGQSSKYRDHPSNVGSPSYFADTGRGWVPNPGESLNKRNIVRIGDMPNPGSRWRRGDNRFAGARQAMTSDPAYRGITATAPGQNYIMAATDKDKEKQAAFDHPAYAHLGPWWGSVMDKFGGLTEGALRGSRLHKSYKDKYGDSKQWEADKKMMASGWDLKPGEAGYEGSDKQFYDKYMNLADMAQDSTKAQEYRDTAETAWRNKQTSDRLAYTTGFEDYAPSKYTGVGEGSRYTGDAYEGQGRTGEFVPGVGIMDDIIDRLPAQGGYDMDFGGPLTPAGGPISITDNRNIDLGGPLTPAGGPILEEDITEDITADVGGLLPAGMPLMPNQQMRYEPLTPAGMNAGVDWGRYELPQKRGFQGDPVMSEWQDLSWRDSDSPITRTFGVNKIPSMGSKFDEGDRYYNAYDLANMDEEEETFIKPKTNLRGRLGLYD